MPPIVLTGPSLLLALEYLPHKVFTFSGAVFWCCGGDCNERHMTPIFSHTEHHSIFATSPETSATQP
jgi:hypothetical protein